MHRSGTKSTADAAEALRVELELRHDPVRLNAHCFWMMWQYFAAGRFADCVATCDRGIELAGLIGTQPVQYGSIKSLALTEMGRFDKVEFALGQEVTGDQYPFGQAMEVFGRSAFLTRIGAWRPAADSLVDCLERATALTRVWMQQWAASLLVVVAAHLRVNGADDADALTELAAGFGDWGRGGLTGAELALIEGRPGDALAMSGRSLDGETTHDRVVALDIAARANLALGDHAAAAEVSAEGLAAAEQTGFGSLTWRFRQVRSQALDALGEAEGAATERALAVSEVEALVDCIESPILRDSFRRLALATV